MSVGIYIPSCKCDTLRKTIMSVGVYIKSKPNLGSIGLSS
jgi:hypothetical protein